MKKLMDGKYDSVLGSWGFYKAPFSEIVRVYEEWQGKWYELERFQADLDNALARLDPPGWANLSSKPRCSATLFTSTSFGWTAIFEQHPSGPQAAVPYIVEHYDCIGLRVLCVEDTYDENIGKGQYGSVQFQMYSPHLSRVTKSLRAVTVTNDEGNWQFRQSGTPQPFERLDQYKARPVRDRFT
jgi:hypothetical protein